MLVATLTARSGLDRLQLYILSRTRLIFAEISVMAIDPTSS
jgi:hypothetical protein